MIAVGQRNLRGGSATNGCGNARHNETFHALLIEVIHLFDHAFLSYDLASTQCSSSSENSYRKF
jgi:hypothetical protein